MCVDRARNGASVRDFGPSIAPRKERVSRRGRILCIFAEFSSHVRADAPMIRRMVGEGHNTASRYARKS